MDFNTSVPGVPQVLSSVYAGFQLGPQPVAAPATCAGTMSGDCCFALVSDVTPSPTADASAQPQPTVGAGPITATSSNDGGVDTLASFFVEADSDVVYDNPTGNLTWTGGDTLTFSAAGETVAPFMGSIVAVSGFTDLTPSFVVPPDGGTLTFIPVTRSAGLTLTFTPDPYSSGNDDFTVRQSSVSLGSNVAQITCTVPDSRGSLTVPPDLLAHMQVGMAISLIRREGNIKTLYTSNAVVTVQAYSEAEAWLTFQ